MWTMESLKHDIFNMQVADTHNHFDIDPSMESISAQNFWDLGEYFWLRRHLWSAGYPVSTENMSFEERADCYINAFKRTENTIWARALKQGIRELYNIELNDKKSIYEIDQAVKENARRKESSLEVLDKAHVKWFVVNSTDKKRFGTLEEKAIGVPYININFWAEKLQKGEPVTDMLQEYIRKLFERKVTGIRINAGMLNGMTYRKEVVFKDMTHDDCLIATLHIIGAACEKFGLCIQIFLGVVNGYAGIPIPFEDTQIVPKLYGLFEKYQGCTFSLLTASQTQNIDVVNAANIYSNVQADGLWWYNLRPSSYKEVFECRLEELPSVRSAIVASDAYTAEWCYMKLNVIRQALYEFMVTQIQKGHIDEELARIVSQNWLCHSAEELFGLN